MPNPIASLAGLLALFLMLALPDPLNIIIPLYLTIFVWTILRPRVALYLMTFAVPWGSLYYIDVKGLRLNIADLLVAFLAVAWLLSFALRRTNTNPSETTRRGRFIVPTADLSASGKPTLSNQFVKTYKPHQRQYIGPLDRDPSAAPIYLIISIIALLAVMILSMTVAVNISSSLKEISKWLEYLVLIFLGAQYVRTRRQLWIIVILICLAGITQAFFGYFQAFFNIGPVAFIRDTSLRIYGTFDQPNPYAGYINIPLSIALALTILGSNWKTRILAGITSILLAAAEYLTQSRGGEIAIAVSLLFIVAVGTPRLTITVKLFTLAGLAVVEAFLVGLIPVYIFNPILKSLGVIDLVLAQPTQQNFSTAERLAHWIAGINMYLDHPILGVGIGNYPDAYPHYIVTPIFSDPLGHAHNYYINIAAETGTIGLIVYLLFLLATFLVGARAYRSINKKLSQISQDKTRYSQFTRSQSSLPANTNGTYFARPRFAAPVDALSLKSKLIHLLRAFGISQYDQHQSPQSIMSMLTNDKALTIGLLAAIISICMHNIFDDLYVHSITNLIALLVIALIRLENVTPNVTVQQDGRDLKHALPFRSVSQKKTLNSNVKTRELST
jgi:O-antigen ligase